MVPRTTLVKSAAIHVRLIVGTVVTCIFDVLFIAIMGMGRRRAGWAMLLANGASMLYYLVPDAQERELSANRRPPRPRYHQARGRGRCC